MILYENLPTWVNTQHLEKLLEDIVPDFEKIIRITVKSEENVLSSIFRLRAEIQLKDGRTTSMAYKLIPERPAEDLLSRLGVLQTDDTKTAPPNFGPSVVLFVDLQAKGYKSVSPAQGLDLTQTKAALEQMAHFHASSVIDITEVKNTDLKTFQPNQKNSISNRKFQESLRSYNLRHFEDIVKTYQQHLEQNLTISTKADPLEFKVLLLGACSSNNLFFQYDAFGNIKETLFIDFKAIEYGSPAKDLLYFLLTSIRWEDKLKNFDYYIKCYHDHLIAKLKFLSYTGTMPSLTDLHLAILKYSPWGFIVVTKILPVVLLAPTPSADIDLNDLLKLMYSNPLYGKQIEQILPWMENRGYLEE